MWIKKHIFASSMTWNRRESCWYKAKSPRNKISTSGFHSKLQILTWLQPLKWMAVELQALQFPSECISSYWMLDMIENEEESIFSRRESEPAWTTTRLYWRLCRLAQCLKGERTVLPLLNHFIVFFCCIPEMTKNVVTCDKDWNKLFEEQQSLARQK